MSDMKKELREKIWRLLEDKSVDRFPKPIHGRIPNYEGSKSAARRILSSEEYLKADVVKVNPDYPQLAVRRGILQSGKVLIMPSPRLKSGFLILDPRKIRRDFLGKAATIRGSFQFGKKTELDGLPFVDLVVCGSVAVTKSGLRVGKGGGYSELEYAVLRELNLVDEETPIMTTVHDLQIVKDAPREEHDFTIDFIATPTRMLASTGPRYRPSGIIWEKLLERQLEDMPILKKLREIS